MIAISHPTGNANVRALLQGLERSAEGSQFFTTVACSGNGSLTRLLPEALRRELLRRDFGIPSSRIHSQPLRELVRLLALRLKLRRLTSHEAGWACVDAVYRALDDHVAGELHSGSHGGFRAVHAYEDGALETFRAASERGMLCSYELPIAYWETSHALLRQEAGRFPDWEPTLIGTRDSDAKLQRKTEELELANLVVCPSRFVLESVPLHIRNSKRCIMAPFGSPERGNPRRPATHSSRPLRVLFAGSMTQRKGLADLFNAVRLLGRKDVELVVMGSLLQPLEFYRERCPQFTYEPPRPHREVLTLMESCDVLALPSIVEGRALVQQEAMSCGLPLIVTPNAGGEDLIEEGGTGFLVPIRSPERIAECIEWFVDHRDALGGMSELAQRKAASVTWTQYADSVIEAMASELDSQDSNRRQESFALSR